MTDIRTATTDVMASLLCAADTVLLRAHCMTGIILPLFFQTSSGADRPRPSDPPLDIDLILCTSATTPSLMDERSRSGQA